MKKGELIGRGRTAEIFAWGDSQILKLYLKESPAEDVEFEARVTREVHKAGLPVPAVEGVVEVDERYGIVFERVDGPVLTMGLVSQPWKFFKLARMMAELHAAIHSCEIPWLRSQREDLKMIIRDRVSLPDDIKKGVLEMLEHLPDGNALCHNDFHPGNILMTAQGPIIIDWLTAKRGNPLADVARTSLLLCAGTEPGVGTVLKWFMNQGGSLIYSIYLKKYMRLKSVSKKEIDAWLPILAAARLAENIPEEKRQLMAIIHAGLKA